jgi:hypothetical protein
MPLQIEIPIGVVVDIFESRTIPTGTTIEAPGGAVLTVLPGDIESRSLPPTMAYDADPVIHALVEFAGPVSAVALNLFSTWLYDKFKGSKTTCKRLKINEEWTELTPEGISRTIKKSIEYEKKS